MLVANIHRRAGGRQDCISIRRRSAGGLPANKSIPPARARSVIMNMMGPIILRFHSIPLRELPPPAPGTCFGREGLVEKVVELAKDLKPIALIGPGGIGKTSIALSVLHDNRIKERFGDNRRLISCDQFPGSPTRFLAHLSKVIGAQADDPEDLAPLRPLLSSTEMLIVLDGAEAILDPQIMNGRDAYDIVDELSQFEKICLCVTSRITVLPLDYTCIEVPTLSKEAACETFYGIYGSGGRSIIIEDLLQRLDFHPLSITLLAATTSDNAWDCDRLTNEWDKHRERVFRTDQAATIEFSLASPTFCKLGPSARDLLGVVAFFPQGVDERNLECFFPTIPNIKNIFDKFCALSLAYRSNGFVTMLAPIRDYLHPQDPKSSTLLCATMDCYFAWLSVDPSCSQPWLGDARWIQSEDTNVEHLLDIFTSIVPNSLDVWDACDHFMRHLYWQKPRQTVLKSKIESLPDDHPSKPRCLFGLSWLFGLSGNFSKQKLLLGRALVLEEKRGADSPVALILRSLSQVNRIMGCHKEGIAQAKGALRIYERLGNTAGQAECLHNLTLLLLNDNQLDAAEGSTLRTIDLLPEEGQEYLLSRSHRILGEIYTSKGEKEKAIDHFRTALGIASPFDWEHELFGIHHTLALLFSAKGEFDVANTHIVQAKSHVADNTYKQGRAMNLQAWIWYQQHRLEDARSEALGAFEIYEKFGQVQDVGVCRELLKMIEEAMESWSILDAGGEFPSRGVNPHPC